jgi:alanine-glyoxylate transaminase/serine-glyoxylate transaminase/serine-pyruvate transaminase
MKQRKLLMIPGPIEFTPEALAAMSLPTTSHVAPNFIDVFAQSIGRLREVFLSSSGQPFVVAGSGTLAMDMAAANLVEGGDPALVVNTGFFSDRFGAILGRYGAAVTHIKAPAVGGSPALKEVEAALRSRSFKIMTITHVDTSTAVRSNVKDLAALGRKHGALVVV